MRHRHGARLVGIWVAVAVVVGAVVGGAAAVTASRPVAVKVKFTGAGTVRLNSAFTCRLKYRRIGPGRSRALAGDTCRHTFHVPRGQQVVVKASPKAGWKLTAWGGACKSKPPTSHRCHLGRLTTGRGLTVNFVPPGDWLNPYPLGTSSARLYGGWRVRVNSAIINADTQVEAVIDPSTGLPANPPPSAGSQYTLVNVTLTYLRRGSHRLDRYVIDAMHADGATADGGLFGYQADAGCEPPPFDPVKIPGVTSAMHVCEPRG